jgi:hypothetical protein
MLMKGQLTIKHAKRRRRRQFLDFMNEVVHGAGADQELHVILG